MAYEKQFARREVFMSKRAKYVTIKLQPADLREDRQACEARTFAACRCNSPGAAKGLRWPSSLIPSSAGRRHDRSGAAIPVSLLRHGAINQTESSYAVPASYLEFSRPTKRRPLIRNMGRTRASLHLHNLHCRPSSSVRFISEEVRMVSEESVPRHSNISIRGEQAIHDRPTLSGKNPQAANAIR